MWDQDHASHDIMCVVCVCARTNDIMGSPKVSGELCACSVCVCGMWGSLNMERRDN